MPAPAVPRRAAPPRKKAHKSPAPIADPETQLTESPASGTPQETSDEGSKMLQADVLQSKVDEAALGLAPATFGPATQHITAAAEPSDNADQVDAKDSEEHAIEEHAIEEPAIEEPSEYASTQTVESEPPEPSEDEHAIPEQPLAKESISAEQPTSPKEPETLEPKEDKEEGPEEDEAERRKRIAERLRQQGGFNPFSAPPIRKPSIPPSELEAKSPNEDVEPAKESESPVEHTPTSPPLPLRRQSTHKDSTDATPLSPKPVISKHGSVDHIQSPVDQTVSSPIESKPVEPVRTSSISEGDSDKREVAEDGN
jgi:hypothetical protein